MAVVDLAGAVGFGVGPVLSVAEVVDLAVFVPDTWCAEWAESGVSS